MRYAKFLVVLLALSFLVGGCSLGNQGGGDSGLGAESTRVAIESTPTALESTRIANESTRAALESKSTAAADTPPTVAPTAETVLPTAETVPPTATTISSRQKTGPTDEELARKRLLEEQFAQNPRYPAEQVYFNNAVIFVYRVPNDLMDLGIFLGYKVTPEQRDALFSYPYYSTSKEIEGELFRWIWREGAVEYLKSQGAKPYWWEP